MNKKTSVEDTYRIIFQHKTRKKKMEQYLFCEVSVANSPDPFHDKKFMKRATKMSRFTTFSTPGTRVTQEQSFFFNLLESNSQSWKHTSYPNRFGRICCSYAVGISSQCPHSHQSKPSLPMFSSIMSLCYSEVPAV